MTEIDRKFHQAMTKRAPHGFRRADGFERGRDGIDGTRKVTDLVVLHWTGSENPVDAVVRNMRARKTRDGRGLSAHFFIGAAGRIHQVADLDAICRHASGVNARAIGIEIQSRGLASSRAAKRGVERGTYRVQIHGRQQSILGFTANQIDAVEALVSALCRHYHIPRVMPATDDCGVLTTIMAPNWLAEFRGVVGHYHVSQRKLDPGPLLLDELDLGGGQ